MNWVSFYHRDHLIFYGLPKAEFATPATYEISEKFYKKTAFFHSSSYFRMGTVSATTASIWTYNNCKKT